MMELVVTVKEIEGQCPTYKVGDCFSLKACYQLVSEIPVCMHGSASLMPYCSATKDARIIPAMHKAFRLRVKRGRNEYF